MIKLICYVLTFTSLKVWVIGVGFNKEDINLPLEKLITKYGYPFEEHEIVTADGYILKTHRISHGKDATKPNTRPVLFLHGMGGSSENILALGPGRGLGFVLADRGYDVWSMNARGNHFSRKHKYLDPYRVKFWDFCLDELMTMDTPANIDYILNVTKQKQVALIGHSQGSAVTFGFTSGCPEYNDKISVQVHLAPSFFLSFITELFTRLGAKHYRFFERFLKLLRLYEFNTPSILATNQYLLANFNITHIAVQAFPLIAGTNSTLFTGDVLPFMLRSSPSGISMRQFLQYLQVAQQGTFRKYDFNPAENLRRYNSTVPPFYDVRKITSPAILVRSKKDWMSPPEQTEFLIKHMNNKAQVYIVKYEEFSHFDYIGAYNAKELLYDDIIDMMDKIPYK